MSSFKSTIVYTSSGTVKLTQQDRRKLVSTLAKHGVKDGKPVPHWVGSARLGLQTGNSFSMPVGWVGSMVVNDAGAHSDCCYAVVSYPLDEERIALISLRSALIDIFTEEDVVIHVPTNKIAHMFIDDDDSKPLNVSPLDKWEMIGIHADIINECKRIIQMRCILDRKTAITSEALVGFSKKLAEFTDHVNKVEHGVADRIIFDAAAVNTGSCTERLYNAADQLDTILRVDNNDLPYRVEPKSVQSPNEIDQVINNAVIEHSGDTCRDGNSTLSLICSSCVDGVRVTRHANVDTRSISVLATTHCKKCTSNGSDIVKLKPELVRRLTAYSFLQHHENVNVTILTDGEYVRHIDAEKTFRALTLNHSIGTIDYDSDGIVELRGGFF